MTVAELITCLSYYPADMPVRILGDFPPDCLSEDITFHINQDQHCLVLEGDEA
jgi:hypothetical protein